jgi:hypothetical protein
MAQAKNPSDRCGECDHPRSAHSEYTTPHCSGGTHDKPCVCQEFIEPQR